MALTIRLTPLEENALEHIMVSESEKTASGAIRSAILSYAEKERDMILLKDLLLTVTKERDEAVSHVRRFVSAEKKHADHIEALRQNYQIF